jgi:drug/metabolite transporter (DMT)-like permease
VIERMHRVHVLLAIAPHVPQQATPSADAACMSAFCPWPRLSLVPRLRYAAPFAAAVATGGRTARTRVQVCFTKGLTYGRAASVMCMQYFSVVVSEILGAALFHEVTSGLAALGMCIVVASMVAFVTWEARRKQAGASGRLP